MPAHGLAVDKLLSAEMTIGDGSQARSSGTDHPDLFWAICGGGGNFGIVTRFEFRLHAVGPTILGGMVLHPIEHAKQVLQFYRDFSANCPDELSVYAALLGTPEGLPVVALIAGWFGPLEEGANALAPLRSFGSPIADLIAPQPYTQLQSMLEGGVPFGLHRY